MKKVLTGLMAVALPVFYSCSNNNSRTASDDISIPELKRGDIVLCGPADKKFGTVNFVPGAVGKMQKEFGLGLALLHSFEYDEAEKMFAKVIDGAPDCAMAYWGVAMSNFHALWSPPTQAELEKGSKAISIAHDRPGKSDKEDAFIHALGAFYEDWQHTDHRTRCMAYENAMEKVYNDYRDDKEAAIFYALALDAAADPTDTTYASQRKAGKILESLYPGQPEHPGIVHYIIHSYDYPALAEMALPAARKYASVAPGSAHAQHMPSHIFTRLGLWQEAISANLASVSSAQCYAESAGMKGHWDEELHGLDYLVYAYLQRGDNANAKKQWEYLKTIHEVSPANFKVSYSFAAVPARYTLENRSWKEAAGLSFHPAEFNWTAYPWQRSIIDFAKALGSAHTGNLPAARKDLAQLKANYDTLISQKDNYKATQVQIQYKAAEAWILWYEGKRKEALAVMREAADREDHIEKHPVTPGEVLPARELLGDMLMEMNEPDKALAEYEASLKRHPNRFNGLQGAMLAAEKTGNPDKANAYKQQLISIADPASEKIARYTTAHRDKPVAKN